MIREGMFFRRYSTVDPFRGTREWVQRLRARDVPLGLFSVRYDRASGPGGQNVNKVSTKCTATIDKFTRCSWFPVEIRNLLATGRCSLGVYSATTPTGRHSKYYFPVSDTLVLRSDETRSREKNKALCMEKLVREISECKFPGIESQETLARWKNIKKRSNEGRLNEKKKDSKKKESRRKPSFDY
ncbi:hypothetical protein RNJ44_00197 [Nakaseomyces bracarensis]|uniref:Prokaryotic-type class I peptide chain release factors domain-containing protein n=1 Tax=Nakaseomyces bracarensis TaxID=273131 RepID=A0ABR4NT95_9SACH